MNRKQRESNRKNADFLSYNACICPECGERGKHWIQMRWPTLEDILFQHYGLGAADDNGAPNGFWTCAKFYNKITGRRLDH